ncbi:hypothetical protein BC835DRAFT_1404461 [Cytidiella melzeri]|nr:hypothetical protein BC835DRAFT_1404461 [Cytidiella melzeri]
MGKSRPALPLSSTSRVLYSLLGASAGLTVLNSLVSAQTISTSIQVPPLQWINLTGLLSGPAPPPLKDASIGYDDNSRMLLIFGGESQEGVPQSQTYLLNLGTLAWVTISAPGDLTQQPPARSAAISAQDSAASYRTGHVIFGGRGTNGPLSDVWEYSFDANFWTEVQVSPGDAPSARWAAVGGNDPRATTTQDPHLNTPNNTFFVAGGFDANGGISLSDLWQFNVTGTLSANLPQDVVGSWQKLILDNTTLPATGGSASGAILQTPNQFIAAVGGCGDSIGADAACAQNASFVLNLGTGGDQSIATCPAPRVGATVSPNMSGASSSFTSQVFQILGTFDSSQWDDNNGLSKGEVDILDVDTGAWARILPAGDPASGQPTFPSPRQGAVAVAFPRALTGLSSSRDSASDTIVFGGRDASGKYLSDIWLLRAYNGVVTQSKQQWSGYGNGKLQSGVDANGEGVSITYMPHCATFIGKTSSTSSSSGQPSSTTTPTTATGQPSSTSGSGSNESQSPPQLDTSSTHKILAPVSVAATLPAILFYRLSFAPTTSQLRAAGKAGLVALAATLALSAFAVGVAGIATAFRSITYTSSLPKRSSVPALTTAHGRAGIALFVGLYVLLAFTLCLAIWRSWRSRSRQSRPVMRTRTLSNDLAEKAGLNQSRAASPGPHELTAQAQPRARERLLPWPFSNHGNGGRRSSESRVTSDVSSSPTTSFEVVRPARIRRASANSLAAFSDPRSTTASPHNLTDMGWSSPRRSSSRLNGLDDTRRAQDPSTPGTAVMEITSTQGLMDNATEPLHPEMPHAFEASVHLLLQAFLLALCVLCLIALWKHAPIASFAIFLVWTIGFYVFIFILACFGTPRVSILSALVSRLRPDPVHPRRTVTSPEAEPFTNGHGPYRNQPPYRTAHESGYLSNSHAECTAESHDDDEDDETRQRRIEEEMSRREVSVITVPKRKLVPKNPDPELS